MKLPSPMVAVSNTQVTPCPHRESKCSSFNSLHAVNYSCFLSSTDFFQIQLLRKIVSGMLSECQTVWIKIRPDILLGLILVQTVCKGYQQTTLVGKEFSSHWALYGTYHTCSNDKQTPMPTYPVKLEDCIHNVNWQDPILHFIV